MPIIELGLLEGFALGAALLLLLPALLLLLLLLKVVDRPPKRELTAEERLGTSEPLTGLGCWCWCWLGSGGGATSLASFASK